MTPSGLLIVAAFVVVAGAWCWRIDREARQPRATERTLSFLPTGRPAPDSPSRQQSANGDDGPTGHSPECERRPRRWNGRAA